MYYWLPFWHVLEMSSMRPAFISRSISYVIGIFYPLMIVLYEVFCECMTEWRMQSVCINLNGHCGKSSLQCHFYSRLSWLHPPMKNDEKCLHLGEKSSDHNSTVVRGCSFIFSLLDIKYGGLGWDLLSFFQSFLLCGSKIAVMCQQNAHKKNEVVISHHFCMRRKWGSFLKLFFHFWLTWLTLCPKYCDIDIKNYSILQKRLS